MAQFKVSGNMKVKTLKENFFESYGAVLRVYYKNHFADDEATLATIREGDAKGGEFECGDQDLVGVFENFMEELYGIKVQIASPDNKKLAKNDMKLCDLVNMAPVKERGKRAKVTYRFNGGEYTQKNRFCQAVVRYYADQHPEAKLEDLQKVFGEVQKFQMVASREQALTIFTSDGTAGGDYFLGEGDEIDVRGGKAFAWKYFSKTFFDPFMAKVKELGYEFEVVGEVEENEGTVVAEIQENVLNVVKEDGKYGFADETGKVVIPCIYNKADDFSNGMAKVKKGWKYGFIDQTGNEIIPFKYDCIGNPKDWKIFYEGLARIVVDGKYGFMDKTGKEVIPCQYDYACNFEKGMAEVLTDDGAWIYIDKDGNFVKEQDKKEETINFFDCFFNNDGERIYAMYDYDDQEDEYQKQVTVELGKWKEEEEIETIKKFFYGKCERDIKINVDELSLTQTEIYRFMEKYVVAYEVQELYDITFKGIPAMIFFWLANGVYKTQLKRWSEDKALIDFDGFEVYVDIDLD